MTQPATPPEAQALADEQAEEYGQYRAIAPIDHGGVRAYNVGHPVPASNVVQYGYLDQGLVERAPVPQSDEPRPAVSGEPGGAHLAFSGEPGGDTADTGNPDHASTDITEEH